MKLIIGKSKIEEYEQDHTFMKVQIIVVRCEDNILRPALIVLEPSDFSEVIGYVLHDDPTS